MHCCHQLLYQGKVYTLREGIYIVYTVNINCGQCIYIYVYKWYIYIHVSDSCFDTGFGSLFSCMVYLILFLPCKVANESLVQRIREVSADSLFETRLCPQTLGTLQFFVIRENVMDRKGTTASDFVLQNSQSSIGSLGSYLTFDHIISIQIK